MVNIFTILNLLTEKKKKKKNNQKKIGFEENKERRSCWKQEKKKTIETETKQNLLSALKTELVKFSDEIFTYKHFELLLNVYIYTKDRGWKPLILSTKGERDSSNRITYAQGSRVKNVRHFIPNDCLPRFFYPVNVHMPGQKRYIQENSNTR